MMVKKYNGLNDLLSQDTQANKYFSQLPDYVRDHISTRAQNVKTYYDLRDFAENLMRGED